MSAEDHQALAAGDTVVFQDAYTNEAKYGRVEHAHGSTFIVHIIPREKAGPNPKPLKVRQPCKLVTQFDGVRICNSHRVQVVPCELVGEQNPPGLGQVKAWACPVSQKQFLEAEGL